MALVFLPGVHYYTGQAFDIQAITAAAHKKVGPAPHRQRDERAAIEGRRHGAGVPGGLRPGARGGQRGAAAARLGRRLCVLVPAPPGMAAPVRVQQADRPLVQSEVGRGWLCGRAGCALDPSRDPSFDL